MHTLFCENKQTLSLLYLQARGGAGSYTHRRKRRPSSSI
jgi:hypothetical protein